jgi:hypothetical protein
MSAQSLGLQKGQAGCRARREDRADPTVSTIGFDASEDKSGSLCPRPPSAPFGAPIRAPRKRLFAGICSFGGVGAGFLWAQMSRLMGLLATPWDSEGGPPGRRLVCGSRSARNGGSVDPYTCHIGRGADSCQRHAPSSPPVGYVASAAALSQVAHLRRSAPRRCPISSPWRLFARSDRNTTRRVSKSP